MATVKKYVNFNDESLPIGKRKQAYVKWAVSQGTKLDAAKRQANKKFGFEKKAGIFAIVSDYGRTEQRSYRGPVLEIFQGYDLAKYEKYEYVMHDQYHESILRSIVHGYKENGWDVIAVTLYA